MTEPPTKKRCQNRPPPPQEEDGGHTCLYDDLFDLDTMNTTIDKVYPELKEYNLRNFGFYLQDQDDDRLKKLDKKGNRAALLVNMLGNFGFDAAVRKQIENGTDHDPETDRKVAAYERLCAQMLRSFFVSPFDETNAQRILLTGVGFCIMAWRGFDAAGLERLCDIYGARPLQYD
jgi:hypothetical protein